MEYNQQKFNEFLLEKGVVGFKPLDEPLTLKSGKKSHWYANFRVLSQSKAVSEYTTKEFIVPFLMDNLVTNGKFIADWVLGVPEGATKMGDAIHRELIDRGLVEDKYYGLRDKPKEHGDPANRYSTTGLLPNSLALFEDVTTSGISSIEFARKIMETAIPIKGLIAMLNREQLNKQGRNVPEQYKQLGLPYFPMTTAGSVLQLAIDQGEMSKEHFELITKEYETEYAEAGRELPFVLNF